MGLLENLAGGFAILMIGSLVFLTIGFLADYAAADPAREEKPPTRRSLLFAALGWLGLALGWAYWAGSEWLEGPRDWWTIMLGIAWVIIAMINGAQNLRDAKRAA